MISVENCFFFVCVLVLGFVFLWLGLFWVFSMLWDCSMDCVQVHNRSLLGLSDRDARPADQKTNDETPDRTMLEQVQVNLIERYELDFCVLVLG